MRFEKRSGFTLMELLVALAILVAAFSILFAVFTSTLSAWHRGREALAEMHHGDFVMDQCVQSLRSAVFFDSDPELYAFRLEGGDADGLPAYRVSWVTASSAWIPPDAPYTGGMHRVVVSIERTEQGDYGVAVRSLPHLAEEPDNDAHDHPPRFVSTRVKGLRCRVFDDEEDEWLETWEKTDALPSLVEIELYIPSDDPDNPLLTQRRAVEIPVAPPVTRRVEFDAF